MVTAKKVVKRRPPQDWRKAVDINIILARRKRPVKLILLHTCEKNEEIAVNPELILEIGNTTEEVEDPPTEDKQIRVLQSRVSALHEALLYLASRPFKVGDLVKFSGLTRIAKLNGVEGRIRSSSATNVVGYQITLGPSANELVVHNYTSFFTLTALGPETGYVFIPERKITCGFFTCCGGEKIETKETMQDILAMINKAGIGSIHDPNAQMV